MDLWPDLDHCSAYIRIAYLRSKQAHNCSKKKQLDYKVVQNLDYRAMPEDILLAGRSYDNQFQQPILFIVLLGFIASNAIQDTTWILAAWLYVLLRLWHSIEHLKAHNLKRRTYAFGLSSLLLLFMWLAFLVSRLV